MRYGPYPEYRDSGLEWLGTVPAHWDFRRRKHLWTTCDYGISDSLKEGGGVRVLTMGSVNDGEVRLPARPSSRRG